jgi:hypothetical protein
MGTFDVAQEFPMITVKPRKHKTNKKKTIHGNSKYRTELLYENSSEFI